jgi:hypothetical protein
MNSKDIQDFERTLDIIIFFLVLVLFIILWI